MKRKKALEAFFRARGLKVGSFIEQAVLEKLEDELDAQAVRDRAHETTVPWKRVV